VASIAAIQSSKLFHSDVGTFQMKSVSTREASRKLGISLISVQRYIAAKKITALRLQKIGGVRLRLWTDRDIKRVRRQLPRIKNCGVSGKHKRNSR
jgi:transposase